MALSYQCQHIERSPLKHSQKGTFWGLFCVGGGSNKISEASKNRKNQLKISDSKSLKKRNNRADSPNEKNQ